MKCVKDFTVDDLGIENSSFFQGYGVSCTPYTGCAVGIGDNPREAIDDCLEQIASSADIDTEDLERRILEQYPDFNKEDLPSVMDEYGEDSEDLYYYIGIKFNLEG